MGIPFGRTLCKVIEAKKKKIKTYLFSMNYTYTETRRTDGRRLMAEKINIRNYKSRHVHKVTFRDNRCTVRNNIHCETFWLCLMLVEQRYRTLPRASQQTALWWSPFGKEQQGMTRRRRGEKRSFRLCSAAILRYLQAR